MPSPCSIADSPAERVVPYDSPKRYFGEFHRWFTVTQRSMNLSNACKSWSTPVKSFAVPLPTARENPVSGASINTRSVLSRRLYWFGTIWYGAGPVAFGLSVTTRTGPTDPMCSQIVAEPGPPLYRNVTGRVFASAPSSVYATEKMLPYG
jgi:hypothetical protein